jgi:AcrR family transcriptional regulator
VCVTPHPETAEAPVLRRDAERNRQKILAAAAVVFAARGLEVTLDDIAREAGVGVGTVYRRFTNREALIDALFETKIGEIVALAEQAAALEDPWEGLRAWIDAIASLQGRDRGLKAVLLSTVEGRERTDAARDRIIPIVEGLVARAKASGELRDDVELTDFPLLELMLGSVAERLKQTDPERWRRYLTIVLDGLRTRRDGPTPLPSPPLRQDELEALMRADCN